MWELHIRNIYTFVGNDGRNVNIDVDALREWVNSAGLEVFGEAVSREKARKILFVERAADIGRVLALSLRPHLEPIIMAKDGTLGPNGAPNALLVDGHHRYVLAALRKQPYIAMYLLEVAQWKPFEVHGLPALTQDELRAIPVTPRGY